MGGGNPNKRAREFLLKEDIEGHRQRTLDVFSTKRYKKARKEEGEKND